MDFYVHTNTPIEPSKNPNSPLASSHLHNSNNNENIVTLSSPNSVLILKNPTNPAIRACDRTGGAAGTISKGSFSCYRDKKGRPAYPTSHTDGLPSGGLQRTPCNICANITTLGHPNSASLPPQLFALQKASISRPAGHPRQHPEACPPPGRLASIPRQSSIPQT